jgi:SAM-dependent methyltransferase
MEYDFKIFRGRLAQFKAFGNEPGDWASRWSKQPLAKILDRYSNGNLDEFEIFTHYLPKHLPVLEAGCGMGQLVMALSGRGYQVRGVDYAEETIKQIKEANPQLDVRVDDVYSLADLDNTYGGYISLGVFEHNPDGPLEGLKELKRVLHPQGVAFISIPFLNPARQKWLRHVTTASDKVLSNGFRFYQYYFSLEDFKDLLHEANLEVIKAFPYAVVAGLTRDYAFGRWLNKHGFFFWRIQKLINLTCLNAPTWIQWRLAHMIMFICKKAD